MHQEIFIRSCYNHMSRGLLWKTFCQAQQFRVAHSLMPCKNLLCKKKKESGSGNVCCDWMKPYSRSYLVEMDTVYSKPQIRRTIQCVISKKVQNQGLVMKWLFSSALSGVIYTSVIEASIQQSRQILEHHILLSR